MSVDRETTRRARFWWWASGVALALLMHVGICRPYRWAQARWLTAHRAAMEAANGAR